MATPLKRTLIGSLEAFEGFIERRGAARFCGAEHASARPNWRDFGECVSRARRGAAPWRARLATNNTPPLQSAIRQPSGCFRPCWLLATRAHRARVPRLRLLDRDE